jgi:hypothetical protein
MASLNLERAVSIFADFLLTSTISALSPILVYHSGGCWSSTGRGDCAFGEAFALALALVLALVLRSLSSNLGFFPSLKGIAGFTGSESLICLADIVEVDCGSREEVSGSGELSRMCL